MKPVTRLLIADDHPFFVDGLINAIRSYPQYDVVAAVHNGDEVETALKKHEPHILILDINLPGKTGLELIPRLKQKNAALKILVLSMYMPADIRLFETNDEVDAYVLKNSGTQTLLNALGQLTDGKRYWDPAIKTTNHHSKDAFSSNLKLSSREKEILHLLRDGLSNKEISVKLFLSELTVKTHRKNMMAKLGARNIVELLRSGV
jgi:DNA-binding NarL/FixJ family response regulator